MPSQTFFQWRLIIGEGLTPRPDQEWIDMFDYFPVMKKALDEKGKSSGNLTGLRRVLQTAYQDDSYGIYYTDGSWFPEDEVAGSAVLEARTGRLWVSRVAGIQRCGRAELQAALGALELSWVNSPIHKVILVTDNEHVREVIQLMIDQFRLYPNDDPLGNKAHIRINHHIVGMAHLDILMLIKNNLRERLAANALRFLQVFWIKAHAVDGQAGVLFNHEVDLGAKGAAYLPKREASIEDLHLQGRDSPCKLIFRGGQVMSKPAMKEATRDSLVKDLNLITCMPADAYPIRLKLAGDVTTFKFQWAAVTWNFSQDNLHVFDPPNSAALSKTPEADGGLPWEPVPCRMGYNAIRVLTESAPEHCSALQHLKQCKCKEE